MLTSLCSTAKIPFIIGDQEDEATLFALTQFNLSTTADVEKYLISVFFHDATPEIIRGLVAIYPDDPAAGSPFGTGDLYEIYPQYKRLAAILGDLTFTLTRRGFLANTADLLSWSYLSSYDEGTPILGNFHGSDLLPAFGTTPGFPSISIQAYYLSFFNTLDPNNGTTGQVEWPLWKEGKVLLNFGASSNQLIADTFRNESYAYIMPEFSSLHI